ncbi:MAG: sigT [Chthonomonadales bacterium]|nr:sigT [Chthonomonadales bacterium]
MQQNSPFRLRHETTHERIEPKDDPDSASRIFLDRLLRGDTDAGNRLVQDFYPHVYRYLLCLTGNPETAQDLTQETFARAWLGLPTFRGNAPIRSWLYRIAYREFLQFLRARRDQVSLEQIPEPVLMPSVPWTDVAELHALISKLPLQERQMIVLHYLEGYRYEEIAGIVGASVGRVRHRLSEARARLRRSLGESDPGGVNRPFIVALRRWAWLPLGDLADLEAGGPIPGHRLAP